ncbi:MAG TPA: hypothetical protein VGP62_12570 [Bryobacteraceae bacterium]|jgi:hypothetical protein|nr:hypothetical protein [Bryobacteraceae bacterium]
MTRQTEGDRRTRESQTSWFHFYGNDRSTESKIRALERWRSSPSEMYIAWPTIALAVIGQGRVDGKITPEEESIVVGKLLGHWALESTLQAAANCVAPVPTPTRPCGCHGLQ